MIILGMTSFGNKIYIDWELDQDGKRVPKFAIFANEIETYQAWGVFEVISLTDTLERFPLEQQEWLEIGLRFYNSQLNSTPNQIDDIENRIGISNAFQRSAYARVFIRAEYKSKTL
jgi:hypothetical protein